MQLIKKDGGVPAGRVLMARLGMGVKVCRELRLVSQRGCGPTSSPQAPVGRFTPSSHTHGRTAVLTQARAFWRRPAPSFCDTQPSTPALALFSF